MRRRRFPLALAALLASCSGIDPDAPKLLQRLRRAVRDGELRLAFGSCHKVGQHPEVWERIARLDPRAVLMLGDNLYADTTDMEQMAADYEAMAAIPEYAALRETTEIWATWDDHDYGLNDAGADYPRRRASKALFVDAFDFPLLDPVHRRDLGVHHARVLRHGSARVQILMLDTRSFRSPLVKVGTRYVPTDDPARTMLGADQWRWLERQLAEPADWRLVCSSIQVISEQHRFEKWANLPRERERLLQALAGANGGRSVILSGDRHLAEISKLPAARWPGAYDLFDVTSSGMTHAGGGLPNEFNRWREQGIGRRRNFGLLTFDEQAALTVTLRDARSGGQLAGFEPLTLTRPAADEAA